MNMPISSIKPGISYTATLGLPGTQNRSGKQKEIVNQVIASLPGNSGQVKQKAPELEQAAADIAKVSSTFNKKLRFVVDHQSNEVIVKVIDKETDKVIKVLPPEELQRLHRKLKETIGFLFNERV